jgi:hypothetical protein
MPVVALLVTAVSTGVSAREFSAADTRNEDDPTVQPLRHMGSMVAEFSSGRHQNRVFHSRQLGEEKGSAGTKPDQRDRSRPYQRRIDRDAARLSMAQLIERIRKME